MNLPHFTEDPLETYRAVEDCSAVMVAAARDQDWDRVARTKQQCDLLIERLRRYNTAQEWPTDRQQARLGILRQVLRNEAELRRLSFPEAAQLDRMLVSHR